MKTLVRVKGSCNSFPSGCVVDENNKLYRAMPFAEDDFVQFKGPGTGLCEITDMEFEGKSLVIFPHNDSELKSSMVRPGTSGRRGNWVSDKNRAEQYKKHGGKITHMRHVYRYLIVGNNPF